MGGKIWAESEVGSGSSFYFTPRQIIPDDDAFEENKRAGILIEDIRPKRNMNILLAEDDEFNSEIIIYLLKREGHEITHAVNGNQVLKNLETDVFDIILMDVQMPEMDGVEATKQIRSSIAGNFDPDIPIIALTAYAMRGDKEKFLQAGMNEYVTKPIDIDNLILKMNQLVTYDEKKDITNNDIVYEDSDYIKDIQKFIEDTKADNDFQKYILESFSTDAQKRMRRLEKAIKAQDMDVIVSVSHKVTGAFGAILIFSASKIIRELEIAARSKEMAKCEELFPKLKSLMHEIINHIQSII